jgi:mono/diheme cytochrome c family protein
MPPRQRARQPAPRIRLAAIIVATMPLMPGAALASDVAAGAAMAQQWCSNCHVSEGAKRGSDAAPSFGDIARRTRSDKSWVRTWLIEPHPPMPNLNLTRKEIDDIVAYLETLPIGK